MTAFTLNKEVPTLALPQREREVSSAETPAARQASKRRPGRVVRRLVSSPVSFYNWLSGPPLTELERSRAKLAYTEGVQGRGALIA